MRNRFLAAALAALALAACGDSPTAPQPGAPYAFTANGRVHTLSGTIPTGLTASVAGVNGPASAPVGADGRFTIQAQVQGDSVEVLIDVAQGTRTTLPALVRVHGRQPGNVTVALVPARWAIQGGTHHGTNVTISMELAFRPPCTTPGDTNCDGFYPTEWVRGIRLWPSTFYPIRLAFDRTRSHQAISASDSTVFWQAVNQMSQDIGTVLFEPARGDQITYATDARPVDAVVVRVDTTLSGFGAWTNWWWNGAGDIVAGVVRPRTTAQHLRNAGLMTHELLHTQGFKHSCSWPTVMGGYGCGQTARLSTSDVAHAQVAMEIRALQRTTGAIHGVGAALQGERRVMLGLTALPAEILFRLLRPQADLMTDGDDVLHSDHAH
jgi:hypothetical protein